MVSHVLGNGSGHYRIAGFDNRPSHEIRFSTYNTQILLPLSFDEQTDKKRYASTGNRTHD